MSWTTALVAGTQIAAGRQADAAGKFNQKIENRNALVKEEEGKVLENKLKLDLEKFDKKFEELEGEVITSVLFSGATLQGSGLRILKKNKEEAELEKEVIEKYPKYELELTCVHRQLYYGTTFNAAVAKQKEIQRLEKILNKRK